ncbi:ATP-dependent DNA helicase RecQ [Ruminococcus sp. YE71]|uniref:DNA helicase RecQ n=1 Tax=unclassified Ruminococcus TaxID=2608920 RepID=UPI000880EA9F|nr:MULTISPECIES: DNA helicase RecQ [unclassified Ruminococcus]SDA19663.1 ATP-dependent DNA helicase RecQ [Ruminococcus sp. YE78]SFW31125.1 ATP-dependent DNA helicase RecQ [Ruminococcus sp. YE71]
MEKNIERVKYELLRRCFGHEGFRSGQEQLVDSILSRRDVLGVMPTGAGKSVCYQLPAIMMRGITLVISPLISLMKDQVNALIQQGIPTAYINSSLTSAQFATAMSRAEQGAYKLIYVAPERLDAPSFRSFAMSAPIEMIAVDEAHCVSQWGQDFRPAYLKIREFAESLPNRPIMAAFTATATDIVRRDIVDMLGLQDPFSLTTGFDRQNLYFAVREPKDKLGETVRLVQSYEGQSGIIYCATRKAVEQVCDELNEQGILCTRYHAGLSDEERRRNQDDFLYDRVRVMTATNAFGMGIDKSNVSFVIHYNMPKNLEAYYQEAGRAGRDGSEAVCTLLFSRKDVMTARWLIDNSNDDADLDDETRLKLRKRDYKRLDEMTRYCTTTDCLRKYILEYFGEKSGTMCCKCSNCAADFVTEDVTLAARKILSCVYRLAQKRLKMGAPFVADVLHGSKAQRIKQFHADELSTYGIMSDTSIIRIREVINGLVDKGYMRKGDFGELILGMKSRELLFEDGRFTMAFKKSEPKGRALAGTRSRGGAYEENAELFGRLRELRSEIAESAKVPAYIIFSDASLHDMCRKLPTDYTSFLLVSGVGQKKAERYGEQFTAVISAYLAENGGGSKETVSASERDLERRSRSQSEFADETMRKIYPASLTLEETASRIAGENHIPEAEALELVRNFLTDGGYVRFDGDACTVTPKGGINGMALSAKVTENGTLTVLVLKRTAQKLISEHCSF